MTTNRQVGHLWAAHNMGTTDKASARSGNGNFWFEGASIYSYRTRLAQFMTAPSGVRFVLHNKRSYSKTTSTRHQPAISRALNGLPLRVIEIDGEPTAERAADFTSHARTLAIGLLEEASTFQAKAARARTNRDWLLRAAEQRAGDAAWLADAYGFTLGSIEEIRAQITAEREGAMAWDAFVRIIREVATIPSTLYDNALQALGDIAAGCEWLSGAEPSPFHYQRRFSAAYCERPRALPTLLRVRGDTVETSRGAEFPLEHGLKALPAIDLAIRRGGYLNGLASDGPRLGHFRINAIGADGTVTAGCHTVPRFAVRWAARSAGECEAPELDHVAKAIAQVRAIGAP